MFYLEHSRTENRRNHYRFLEDFDFFDFFGMRPCGVAAFGTVKVSILDCAKTLRILTASAAVDRRATGWEDSEKELKDMKGIGFKCMNSRVRESELVKT